MSDGGVLVYCYDGSYEGLLCTIFDSFIFKKEPDDVIAFDDMVPTFLKVHMVETNLQHARRVDEGIAKKLGKNALLAVKQAFLFDEGGKEMVITKFLWKGFTEGRETVSKLGDPIVNRLMRMSNAVGSEAHLLKGFTRFTDVNGALVAVIHPKHYVLPLLRGHFCARLKCENFLIFDETHRTALIHSGSHTGIIPMDDIDLPKCENDVFYRNLWKTYYCHITISSRFNPRCQAAHMPKRFWNDMPEVAEQLSSTYKPTLSKGTKEDIVKGLRQEKYRSLTTQV